jgi:hypothetical protein
MLDSQGKEVVDCKNNFGGEKRLVDDRQNVFLAPLSKQCEAQALGPLARQTFRRGKQLAAER